MPGLSRSIRRSPGIEEVKMNSLCCIVIRGLAKELEAEVNKFLELTLCHVQFICQSEFGDHINLTIFYGQLAKDEG